MSEINISKELEESIVNNNIVIFIGAGCSIPMGFPNWNGLVLEILNKLDEDYGKSSGI